MLKHKAEVLYDMHRTRVFGRANPYPQNRKEESEKLKLNRHNSIKLIQVICDQFKSSQRWFHNEKQKEE
jgi:hypothetical protein